MAGVWKGRETLAIGRMQVEATLTDGIPSLRLRIDEVDVVMGDGAAIELARYIGEHFGRQSKGSYESIDALPPVKLG